MTAAAPAAVAWHDDAGVAPKRRRPVAGPRRAMRILVITESFVPRVNGVTRTVMALTRYLSEQAHEALVFAAGPGPKQWDGFDVVRVPGVGGLIYPDLTISPLAARLPEALARFRPDVVHLASPAALGVSGALMAMLAGMPVAAHYQTDLAAYARHYGGPLLERFALLAERHFHNRCTANYAPTEEMAAELRRRGIARVSVSGRGIDTMLFRPDRRGAAWAARRWPSGDGPRVLCVSRLAREKRLDLLVEAARRDRRLRVLVVGDGPSRGELATRAPRNVRFAGILEGDELADVYAAAHIFAFPSPTETFGQVVQEAMASGLPVVGVAAGGVATLVTPGETGLLASPDRRDFSDALSSLAHERGRCREMGLAARTAMLPRSWNRIFDGLLDDYRALSRMRRPLLSL